MANRIQLKWIMLLAGIAIGALAMWGFSSLQDVAKRGVTPYVVEGYSIWMNSEGTAITVSESPERPTEGTEGYNIAGATWREFDGPWHLYGFPSSLTRPNISQKVRLGIVNVKPIEAPGRSVVVWLEVLSQ